MDSISKPEVVLQKLPAALSDNPGLDAFQFWRLHHAAQKTNAAQGKYL